MEQYKTKQQIISLNSKYTCNRLYKNSQATSTWLAHRYSQRIRANPKLSVNALKKTILAQLKLEAGEFQVYRAKERPLRLLKEY